MICSTIPWIRYYSYIEPTTYVRHRLKSNGAASVTQAINGLLLCYCPRYLSIWLPPNEVPTAYIGAYGYFYLMYVTAYSTSLKLTPSYGYGVSNLV